VAPKYGRLTSTLRLPFLLLLLTTVALSWFTYDIFGKYDHKLRRIASAQLVLRDIHQLARLTLLELNALGNRLQRRQPAGSTPQGQSRWEILQETVSRLRRETTPGLAPEQAASEIEGQEALLKAVRMTAEIIVTGALIDHALDERRTKDAQNEWARLQESDLFADFAGSIESAIEDQETKIHAIRTESVTGSPYALELLPILILVVAVLSVVLAWQGFGGLVRSADALHEGARAFTRGDLEHRIPKLKVAELSGLAEALNAMADELTERRKRLQSTAARLEATIEERTRALTVSNQKLAEVDATRQRLLSNISHEFRTPLTVIRGQADLALRGGGKTEADYRAAIQSILRQADHATGLVDDLLFIARADAGEPHLKMDSVPVVKLIRSLCSEFAATARQKDLTIEQHTEVKNVVIRGDAKRLRQVFAILLDNGLRYSKPGGTVEVSVSITDEEVQIEFRDYGIGLTEEDAELAFDRFYRGKRAQEHSGGTGLGLSVAKAIVEAHNGSIGLSGKLGAGATARVAFPLASHFKGV
jgi:signal transduction histidine kinase